MSYRLALALALAACAEKSRAPSETPDPHSDTAEPVAPDDPAVPADTLDTGDPVDDADADEDGVEAPADCDDTDPAVFPGAPEVPYDGIDQDCADGDLVDVDGDGIAGDAGIDCNDTDPDSWPGARDAVGDGIDQSCDGVDGEDGDLDGYASTRSGGDDCDDADLAVNPGAAEVFYDGLDADCDGGCDGDADDDGAVAEGWFVADGDACDEDPAFGVGYAPTDCDDANPAAEIELLTLTPADGAVGASLLRPVRATLYAWDPSATLTLAGPAGPVVGATAWVDATLELLPDMALLPSTVYTATLTRGCGVDVWSFTTGDGSGQEILHEWTFGAPDLLALEVVNPVATRYAFGLAETAAGVLGWYGEDCAGALAYGSCHPVSAPSLVLDSVYPMLGSVVPGATTLFDATFDSAITYYLEALDGVQVTDCWAWGHDPSYFAWCAAI